MTKRETRGRSYRKVNRKVLSEQAVAEIQRLIVAQGFRLRDRLPPERELVQEFGVSRTVIREAIRVPSGT